VESLMRPMNMATPKQVAALRRTAKKSAKAPAVSKRKPKSGWKSERLIEQRYSSPEPGIHILDVPCYLWSPNEVLGLLDEKCPIEVARTKKRLMNRDKAAASQAVLGSLARFLPKHCLDTSLRGQFKRVVLSRVSSDPLDDDNNQGALKYVRDTLCGWIVDGPLLSFEKEAIGRYDAIVRSPVNPRGWIDMIYDQDIRAVPSGRGGRYGCVIELSTREWE
jgi:hypothetical protein